MNLSVADDLEAFVEAGILWDPAAMDPLVKRLTEESGATGDPLPARIGRFLESVRLRNKLAPVGPSARAEIEAIVYPRVWKVIEGIRDEMPDSELRTRIEVMNRRLARYFVEEEVERPA